MSEEHYERKITDVRLERIEQKLDKVADAVTAIIRVEEKMAAYNNRMDRFEHRLDLGEEDLSEVKRNQADARALVSNVARIENKLDACDRDLRELQKIVVKNTVTTGNSERFIWLLISASVGAIAYFLRG